jgi:alkanesulfonate monooxygenase SsuD/methylene tetrahydromethanopterin reductase-like flavin-dependent oxidoreductase (luciferase family)
MAGPHVSVVLPTIGTIGHPGDPRHIVATARAAERLGFDGVWTGDHVRHPRPMMESLVALCFAAAHTERIAVEWSVLQIAMRRLPVIAKQIATLACFAPGRVVRFSGPGRPAEVTLPRDSERYTLTGSPDHVISRLREYWDAGADRFKLNIFDTAPCLDQLEVLGREVLPELRTWRRCG